MKRETLMVQLPARILLRVMPNHTHCSGGGRARRGFPTNTSHWLPHLHLKILILDSNCVEKAKSCCYYADNSLCWILFFFSFHLLEVGRRREEAACKAGHRALYFLFFWIYRVRAVIWLYLQIDKALIFMRCSYTCDDGTFLVLLPMRFNLFYFSTHIQCYHLHA